MTETTLLIADNYELLYHDAQVALDILSQRRQSQFLDNLMAKNIDLDLEPGLASALSEPRAILFRQVATPTIEVLLFLECADRIGLKPLIIEFYDDVFVSSYNKYKRGLGKLPIYQLHNSKNEAIIKNGTVLNFNKNTGKKLREVVCNDGTSLVELHHSLFEHVTKLKASEVTYDASLWFKRQGTANDYYKKFMLLFIKHAILFENFVTNSEEAHFAEVTVIPAFKQTLLEFSLPPLIVRHIPRENEHDTYTDYYPKEIEVFLQQRGYSI
jgi:hypothetical protein